MRTFVTGGKGDLGHRLVERLLADHHDVVVGATAPAARTDGATEIAYDLERPPDLDGVDVVFHLASDPADRERDVRSVREITEWASDAGVGHIVFISIVGIDDHPLAYYRTKVAAEKALIASPVPWTILRTTQFHTFVPKAATALRRGSVIAVPRSWRIQPVDADEVARRLLELGIRGPAGRATDLGGPQILHATDAVRRLTARGDRRGRVVGVPLPGKLGAALRAGQGLLGADGEIVGCSYDEYLAHG